METKQETRKLTLKFPIDFKKIEGEGEDKKESQVKITELTFHPLLAKHLKLLPKMRYSLGEEDLAMILPLIAASTRLSEDTVGEMDLRNLDDITKALSPFLPKSLGIGGA